MRPVNRKVIYSSLQASVGAIFFLSASLQGQDFQSDDEFYETRPIDYITTKWSSGPYRYESFGPSPQDWIRLEDVKVAFRLIFDPTPCVSPHNMLASTIGNPKSSVGVEARRLIEGYCGSLYPPMTKTPKDADELMAMLKKKLDFDGLLNEAAKQHFLEEMGRFVADAKSKHTSRILISVGSEADRSRPLTDDELIVEWKNNSYNSLSVNNELITLDKMIKAINEKHVHHLLVKIPVDSDVTLFSIRELVAKVLERVKHVTNVDVRFVRMLPFQDR